MEIITKEQFDALKVGDELKELKNEKSTLLVEAKFANSLIGLTNERNVYFYSLKKLQNSQYSINKPVQHNCGFPFGDYSDKEVIVKVSDDSIEDCDNKTLYVRLKSVSKKEFQDFKNISWKFAVLVSNNVKLVK